MILRIILFFSLTACLTPNDKFKQTINSKRNPAFFFEGEFKQRLLSFWTWYSAKSFLLKLNYPHINGKIIALNEMPEEYKRLNRITEQVLEAFKNKYPYLKKVVRLKKLHVFIINSEEFKAETYQNIKNNQGNPYLITIAKGVLKASDNEIIGLLAHELTHILLQYYYPSGKLNITEGYYNINEHKYGKLTYENIKFDESLIKTMDLWSYYSKFTGERTNIFFGGIGSSYSLYNIPFMKLAIYLSSENSCHNVVYNYNKIATQANKIYNVTAQERFNSKNQIMGNEKFYLDIRNIEQQIKECLNKKINFLPEYFSILKKDGHINKYQSFENFEINFHEPNSSFKKEFNHLILNEFQIKSSGTAFLSIINMARKKIKLLEKNIDFKNIRFYSQEDHADEIALRIIKSMDLNLNEYLSSLSKIINDSNCNYPIEDEPYSPINNRHHNNCWRKWKSIKIFNSL